MSAFEDDVRKAIAARAERKARAKAEIRKYDAGRRAATEKLAELIAPVRESLVRLVPELATEDLALTIEDNDLGGAKVSLRPSDAPERSEPTHFVSIVADDQSAVMRKFVAGSKVVEQAVPLGPLTAEMLERAVLDMVQTALK